MGSTYARKVEPTMRSSGVVCLPSQPRRRGTIVGMVLSLGRRSVVVVLVAALCLPFAIRGTAAGGGDGACSTGFARRREVAHGHFFDRRWELDFYRDRRGRPCLTDAWTRYGSIFRFRVREHRPRLGILHLAATGGRGRSVYVLEAYVQERVSRATFRIDGRTRPVRLVRSPRWTRLPKDLLIHFVGGRRYDRDATGVLRVYDRHGRLLATRTLRRGQFFARAEPI